jgi:hypothetical protein
MRWENPLRLGQVVMETVKRLWGAGETHSAVRCSLDGLGPRKVHIFADRNQSERGRSQRIGKGREQKRLFAQGLGSRPS